MTKKIIAIMFLLIVSAMLIVGCGDKVVDQPAAEESQPADAEQTVTESITEVDDLTNTLEDEELDAEITDIDTALANW